MLDSMPGVKYFCAIQRRAFYCLSIDVTSAECKICRPFLIWIIFICNNIFMLAMGQYCWKKSADFNEFLETISIILTLAVYTIKFLVYLKNRKDVGKLVHKIWILTIEAKTDELSIIAEENAKDFRFSLCYYISFYVSCLASIVLPLCVTLAHYLKTKQWQFLFIVKTSYPFDQTQPFYYFVTYCIHIGCAYFVVHVTVAIDTLYFWLSLNTAAQFRILKLNLKKLSIIDLDSKTYNGIQRCIKRHQQILSITNDIDQTYRMIVFAEVFVNRVVLCLVVYQLGHSGGNFKNLPFLMTYLVCVMVRLIMFCYGGQRIQDESQSIADFIYETFPWHSVSIRTFFFIANFKLFLWIVQTNYSYLSLLWSLEEKSA